MKFSENEEVKAKTADANKQYPMTFFGCIGLLRKVEVIKPRAIPKVAEETAKLFLALLILNILPNQEATPDNNTTIKT